LTRVSHSQALELLLRGHNITEVADMLGVSRTTVYNRRKDFIDYADKEGIAMAAEHYEIEETFDDLMELSRLLKMNEMSIRDAKRGAELVAVMEEAQVSDPEEFMTVVIGEAQRKDLSGDDLTRYAVELKKLEDDTGDSYSQIVENIEDLKEKRQDLEKTRMLLEEQVHAVRSELENSLEEAEVTKERLEDFVSIRKGLIDRGISLEDMEKLEAVVRNIEELEYDPAELIDFYGEFKSVQEKLEINIKENERLNQRNEALRSENEGMETRLEQNLEMVTAVKSQLEVGIEPGDVLEIVNTVRGMGNVLGLNEDEAVKRFITDIKTGYNERSGFTFRVDELKEMHRVLEEKNSLLRERLEVLEEVIEDRKRAVESLRRMETLGIEDSDLIEWGELLEEHEYDVTSFRAEVVKLGGLHELMEEKSESIALLEAREKELESSTLELRRRISALQDTLESLRQAIEFETDKIKQVVNDFELYFTSPETGFKARSRRIVDDIVSNLTMILMETRREWDDDLAHIDNTVEKVVEETDRILANAYSGGRLVGRFHSLEPIHKLLREEDVPKTEATIGVITMLSYIKLWLGKNYPDDLSQSCDEVIERLTRDLGEIYQQ